MYPSLQHYVDDDDEEFVAICGASIDAYTASRVYTAHYTGTSVDCPDCLQLADGVYRLKWLSE